MNYDVISNMFRRTTSDRLDDIFNSTMKIRVCLLVDIISQKLIIRELELKKGCTYYWEDTRGNKYDNFWCNGSRTKEMVIGEADIQSSHNDYWKSLRKIHSRY